MNLSELAEMDNLFLLEDSDNGFARAITLEDLVSPVPNTYACSGQVSRIGLEIDPESGMMIPGSKFSVTIRLSSISPIVPQEGWVVRTTDITGAEIKSKISSVMLDRTSGRATMMLRTR